MTHQCPVRISLIDPISLEATITADSTSAKGKDTDTDMETFHFLNLLSETCKGIYQCTILNQGMTQNLGRCFTTITLLKYRDLAETATKDFT